MILDQAHEKIKYFNSIGIHYEAVYHYIMNRRHEVKESFNSEFLDDITAGLISFDMQRMMGSKKYISEGELSWASKLQEVLSSHQSTLKDFRNFSLQDINLLRLEKGVRALFDDLSKPGPNGLNLRKKGERFSVGASKILHFLIPDLFIIVDSNARRELAKFYGIHKSSKFDGKLYLSAMKYYKRELKAWADKNKDSNFNKLYQIDSSYKKFGGIRKISLPRIIDKCTFVGSEKDIQKDYLPRRFAVFIGGHMGTSYKVEIKKNILIYQIFDNGFKLKEKQKLIPSSKQWIKFWDQVDRLNIWDWKSNYSNPGVCDGTQWNVNIQHIGRQLEARGDNNYPCFSNSSPGKEFDTFLKTLRTLLGGLDFS